MRNTILCILAIALACWFVNEVNHSLNRNEIKRIRDSVAIDGVKTEQKSLVFIDTVRMMPVETVKVYMKKFYEIHDTIFHNQLDTLTDSIWLPVREVKVLIADDSLCNGRLESCRNELSAERTINDLPEESLTSYTITALVGILTGAFLMGFIQ